jgi:hypothetical protein
MALEREVLPDRAEARQEGLSALRQPEAAHAPQEVPLGDAALAFTRGLMTIVGAMVHARAAFDEHVPDVGELGDLGLCRAIAANWSVTILRGPSGHAASTCVKQRFAAALSRRVCSRMSSSVSAIDNFGKYLVRDLCRPSLALF